MNKYEIRNCPAIFKHPVGHWNCQQGKECQDCTDCVIKQILELCNNEKEQETDPVNSSGIYLAQKIVDLFDIEEILE